MSIPWKLNRGKEANVSTCNRSVHSAQARQLLQPFRKEVIQPQVLLQLPCYDFTPITDHTMGGCVLTVRAPTSGTTDFRDVTGGVYKARERIHPGVLIRDY